MRARALFPDAILSYSIIVVVKDHSSKGFWFPMNGLRCLFAQDRQGRAARGGDQKNKTPQKAKNVYCHAFFALWGFDGEANTGRYSSVTYLPLMCSILRRSSRVPGPLFWISWAI